MSTRRYSVCLAMLLAGCSGLQKEDPNAQETEVGSILRKIDGQMTSAVTAQQELAMTAEAKIEREQINRRRLFTDVISWDFYGDVHDIVAEIARRYDYDFAVYGRRPPEGVMVNVFVTKKPAIEILKHVGFQTKWLDLKVTKTAIEIHYLQSPK